MKLLSFNPVDACRGRVATEMDDLQAYLNSRVGKANDIIKKMRVVLETHCRSTYSGVFGSNHNLGHIVERIRVGGEQHPAFNLYEPLDLINEFTVLHHHGDDPTDGTSDQIDADELTGFVRRTLKIVNALQA